MISKILFFFNKTVREVSSIVFYVAEFIHLYTLLISFIFSFLFFSACPALEVTPFSLIGGIPSKELTDESSSLKDLGLVVSSLMVRNKWKRVLFLWYFYCIPSAIINAKYSVFCALLNPPLLWPEDWLNFMKQCHTPRNSKEPTKKSDHWKQSVLYSLL
jgi:hypothetical protein